MQEYNIISSKYDELVKENEETNESDIAIDTESVEEKDLLSIILMSYVKTMEPNSVGGVDLHIKWTNSSEKTIKYIYFYVQPYNAVDDPVTCDITNDSIIKCYSTGPFERGEGGHPGVWECVWYNNTIKYAKITKIEIEYMDGTSIILNEDEAEQAFHFF